VGAGVRRDDSTGWASGQRPTPWCGKAGEMEKEELLEQYEAHGDEHVYAEAKRLYEQALAGGDVDARVLTEYGYLQECHGRRSIRAATDCYERAIVTDPQWPKPHLQLINAMAALGQTEQAIDRYQQRLAAAPTDPRAHGFLAGAYLDARDYGHAAQVIRAGRELAPDDPALTEQQGDVFAATGFPDDALGCWRRAFTLDADSLSPRYSTAFLLERQGRLVEAAREWRFIIGWCEERRDASAADWPRRELQRLEARLAG
jgi:tetratricopeptide (TPR) repeat protein